MSKAYPPKLEDFDDDPWREIVEDDMDRTCFAYGSTFSVRHAAESDPSKKNVWRFLGRVTSFRLDLDMPDDAGQSFIDRLSDDEIAIAKSLVERVNDCELKARLADLVWSRQRKGHFDFVRTAISAYLDSARRLEHPDKWSEGFERVERAMQLAARLGNPSILKEVTNYIDAALDRFDGEDPLYYSIRMMKLLLEANEGEPDRYVPIAEKLAIRAEACGRFDIADEAWKLKADWHRRANDEVNEREARIAAAETHVLLAEERLNQTASPNLHAAGHLEHAIEALRRIPGTQERVKALHRQLLVHQEASTSEMARIQSDTIDLTNEGKNARSRVAGKTFMEAIWTLGNMLTPTPAAEMRKQALEEARDFPFQSLFTSTQLDRKGRVIARRAGLYTDDEDERAVAIRATMYRHASLRWEIHAAGVIEPARGRIYAEHHPRVADFLPITANNPLLPAGREWLFARGLHAGMVGDFLAFMHFIIPQYENMLRFVLERNDIITSNIRLDSLQHALELNTMLKSGEYSSVLEQVFGADTVFDLRGLLVDPHAANLRNELALKWTPLARPKIDDSSLLSR